MNKITFDTTIHVVGNNTGIIVPEEVVTKLGAGKKPAVNVTVNGYTYRNSIASMGGRFLISVSADVRSKTGIKGSEAVTVTLELDTQPREVALPADFEKALKANKEAKAFFESLSYSNKQRYVLPIGEAKTEETRQRRIEKAVKDLSEGKK